MDIRSFFKAPGAAKGQAATKPAGDADASKATGKPASGTAATVSPRKSPARASKSTPATSAKAANDSNNKKPTAAGDNAPAGAGAGPEASKKSKYFTVEDSDEDDVEVQPAKKRAPASKTRESKPAPGSASKPARKPAAKRSRAIEDDDSDVLVISDDDDDDDVDMKDLADEDSDSDIELVDDDEDDTKPSKGSKKKTAPAKDSNNKKQAPANGNASGKASGNAATKPAAKKAKLVIEDSDDDIQMVAVEKKPTSAAAAAGPKQSPGTASGRVAPAAAGTSKPSGRSLPASMTSPAPSAKAAATSPVGSQAPPSTGGRPRTSGKAASGKAAVPPDVAAAIAAVDEAAKKLPAEGEVKFSVLPPGGGGGGNNDAQEPPNYKAKDVPRGHPDCLTGKTFVISGVLDSLFREEAADLVKRHSGRVTQAVSSKTTFLVVGMGCGNTKLNDARKHGTKIIDEDGLFALIKATEHMTQQPAASQQPMTAAAGGGPSGAGSGAVGAGAKPASALGALSGGAAAVRPSGGVASGAAAVKTNRPVENMLWVDKYKPTSTLDLVGNPGHVKTLAAWLKGWEAVHLRGEAAGTSGGGAKPKDLGKKAVLLSGPPGIGKTSAAHIIAKECGWQVVEMNASDTRNKSDAKVSAGMNGKMSNVVREMVTCSSLLYGDNCNQPPKKQLLIMDEVDGMSGGDRGGVADLIQTIHKSKIPIICIANDKYNQKLKSLRNHCLELDFHKPTEDMVSRRCSQIARLEGLQVNDATLRELARSSGGDLRLILGQLQMVRVRSAALSYDDVKGKLGTSKDADMSPFECARKLLEPAAQRLKTFERLDLYFADPDLIPLLIQENYLNHKPAVANTEAERMRAIAKAADSISSGDVINSTLRRTNNWSLGLAVGVVGTLMPCTYMSGSRETFGLYPGEMNFPRFTAWLGNYSSSNKQKRLVSELTTSLAASGHVPLNRGCVRMDYCSALRHLLTKPLRDREDEGIPDALHLMQEYCVNREQFDFILDVTKFKTKAPWGEDPMKDVQTKVKSAFTRRFNQEGLVAKGSFMVEEGVKKGKGKAKKKGGGGGGDEDLEGVVGDGDAPPPQVEEEEEESEDEEALQKRLAQEGVQFVAKAPAGKTSGRGSSRGRGGGRSGAGRGSGSRGGKGSGRGKK